MGSIEYPGIVSTTRLNFTLEELAQPIADSYGEDARAIVCALVRELNTTLDRALDLAKNCDPAFRKACEKHLASLRAHAKREREEELRRKESEHRQRQLAQLEETARGFAFLIEQHESRRRLIITGTRAAPGGDAELPRVTAELDAEGAALQAQLDQAIAARDAWLRSEAKRGAEAKRP